MVLKAPGILTYMLSVILTVLALGERRVQCVNSRTFQVKNSGLYWLTARPDFRMHHAGPVTGSRSASLRWRDCRRFCADTPSAVRF